MVTTPIEPKEKIESRMKKSVSFTLLIICPLYLILPLGMDLFLPVLPKLKIFFSLKEDFLIQLAVVIYTLVFGFGPLFVGPIADRIGRKKIALFGISLFIIGSCICLFSTNVYFFLFGRFTQAFGGSSAFLMALTVVKDLLEDDNLSQAFSYINGTLAVVPVLAPSIGTYLTANHDWQFLFYLLTFLGCLALLYIFFVLPETLIKEEKLGGAKRMTLINAYKTIIFNRNFLLYASKNFLGASTFVLFLSTSSLLLINILQVTPKYFAILFSMFAGIFMLGSFTTHRLVHRFGVKNVTNAGVLLIILGGIGLFIFSNELTVYHFMGPFLFCSLGGTLLLGSAPVGALDDFHQEINGTASSLIMAFSFGMASFLVMIITFLFKVENVYPLIISISFALAWVAFIHLMVKVVFKKKFNS